MLFLSRRMMEILKQKRVDGSRSVVSHDRDLDKHAGSILMVLTSLHVGQTPRSIVSFHI